MYELESENLTHLGGPMGTEYTYTNWRKFFSSIKEAKDYAKKDYLKHRDDLPDDWEWIREKGETRTPDLLFVMYHIRKVTVEK
jgi:hypothetical protein